MNKFTLTSLLLGAALIVTGCGDDKASDDGGTSAPTTSVGDGDGSTFLGEMDTPPAIDMCDFWADSPCDDGEKCQSIASTPGSGAWDATVCVPAGSEPVGNSCCLAGVGDCTVEGPAGTDSCDDTSICLDVDSDTLVGTCTEYCVGPEASASCPQTGATCQKLNGGVLNICIEGCDPLTPGECPDGQTCVPSFASGGDLTGFICFAPGTAEPGGFGDACECANCCQQGHMCEEQAVVGLGCMADFCCTELCDLDAAACSGSDQMCLALFDENDPLYGNVGQCGVPQ